MTKIDDKKTRVMVLFGGQSGEHTISCATAAGVISHIDTDKYEVLPVGITKQGKWTLIDGDISMFSLEHENAYVPDSDTQVILTLEGKAIAVKDNEVVDDLGTVDLVLPLLHGAYGEDGTLQGYLEMCGVKYVGCGVFSSAACMDKHYTKVILESAGLPIGAYVVISDQQWLSDEQAALDSAESLGYPLFVKPCRAGSSLGISRVNNRQELYSAIQTARQVDKKVIVEALATGREVESGVLKRSDGSVEATVGELILNLPENGFYDYENKYLKQDNVSICCPADLPADVFDTVRNYAVSAYQALGCEGIARVDFFCDLDKNQIVINEVNTMPGFTPYSMYPQMWCAAGLTYTQLIDELLQVALNSDSAIK